MSSTTIITDPTGNEVEVYGLAKRLDYTGGPAGSPVYIGWALPGSLTANAVWKITKLTYSGTDLVSQVWADGNTKFDNVWDNRASLTYV